ncbi:sigma-70 family RNA polymerase sigma factor [Pedobacter gandavensis]|uniref:sigma-70 family RNA polymerase sigma factor n=1 Tax=Pedobacter gandavensis TaxID=2679963 RepID=UPI002930796B|nr:sigma-70 family RNA polymerase sigma factor [Pedobacter gandavensis]
MHSEKRILVPEQQYALHPMAWTANYADYLYNYAILRVNDPIEAQDLVQETFLSALEKTSNFEGRSTEKTWLTSILKNKIIDLYRKKSSGLAAKTQALEQEDLQTAYFNNDDGHWKQEHEPKEFRALQQEPMQNKEFHQTLESCMKKLPELWFAVFSMKHLDEEETAVICTKLKVSPSNFWVIIHRTKLSLRACLQKYWI